MQQKLDALRQEILAQMDEAKTGRGLYELKLKFQAELKTVMSGMKDLPKEDRPAFGKIVNQCKTEMEEAFEVVAKQGGPDGCSSTAGEKERMNSPKMRHWQALVCVGLGRDGTGGGQGSPHPPVRRWRQETPTTVTRPQAGLESIGALSFIPIHSQAR